VFVVASRTLISKSELCVQNTNPSEENKFRKHVRSVRDVKSVMSRVM
jgi:hypothetical protein